MMSRREIEHAARKAGPWTKEAKDAVAFLRELAGRTTLTDAERQAHAVLVQREINESIARRKVAAMRDS